MGFMSAEERALAAALSRLGYANPFLPERIEAEGAALGPAFVHADRVWSVRTDRTVQNPNVARLAERATTLAALLRERLAAGAEPAESDRVLYEDVVLYLLYTRYEDDLLDLVVKAADAGASTSSICPARRCPATTSPPICSPASSRSAAPSITSSGTSSAARCRWRACVPPSGNRSSRTT